MKKNELKYFIALAISLLSLRAVAGSEGRGGGDLCEDRIKIVRDDIKTWIEKGGASGLKFSKNVSLEQYSKGMLAKIGKAKIKCVGPGDAGYPVKVSSTPKVCRFDKTSSMSQITCDFDKFQKMTESDQYVLVHHEYAGLADIEQPDDDASNYEISNQLTGYLEDQIVKKLVVKPSSQPQRMTVNGYPATLSAYDVYMLLSQQKTRFMSYKAENIERIKYYMGPHAEEYINHCDYSVIYNEKEKTVTIGLTSSLSPSDSVTISELKLTGTEQSGDPGSDGSNLRIDSLTYSTSARLTGNTVGSTGLFVAIWLKGGSFQLTDVGFKNMKLVDDYDVRQQTHSLSWVTVDDNFKSLGGISCEREDDY